MGRQGADRDEAERAFIHEGLIAGGGIGGIGTYLESDDRLRGWVSPKVVGANARFQERKGLMEHRIDPRLPLQLDVSIRLSNYRMEGITVNLSFGGICLQLAAGQPSRPQLRQAVRVHLELVSSILDFPAIVVHVGKRQAGLMFGRYSDAAGRQLGALFTAWADQYEAGAVPRRGSVDVPC